MRGINNKGDFYKIVNESITDSVTTSITSSIIYEKLPNNAWLILAQFGTYKTENNRPRGFMLDELKRILRDNMHINTLRFMIKRLEDNALIRCYNKSAGKTKTAYRYVITQDGQTLWELYKEEMQRNIGKVEI